MRRTLLALTLPPLIALVGLSVVTALWLGLPALRSSPVEPLPMRGQAAAVIWQYFLPWQRQPCDPDAGPVLDPDSCGSVRVNVMLELTNTGSRRIDGLRAVEIQLRRAGIEAPVARVGAQFADDSPLVSRVEGRQTIKLTVREQAPRWLPALSDSGRPTERKGWELQTRVLLTDAAERRLSVDAPPTRVVFGTDCC